MSANHYNNPDTLTGYGIPDFSTAISYLGLTEKKTQNISVYPNPFMEDIFVCCFSKEGEKVNAALYNELGQITFQQIYLLHSGKNLLTLNPGKYCPPGMYILIISSKLFSTSYHMIKIGK